MRTLRSTDENWKEQKSHWNNGSYDNAFHSLRNLLREAEDADVLAKSLGDVGVVNCTLTESAIQEVEDIEKQLEVFSEKIHDEIIQLLDEPFNQQIQGYVKSIYNLNPQNVKIATKGAATINSNDFTSIFDVIKDLYIDSKLLADFESKMSQLDTDVISKELEEAMDEHLGTWRDEIPFEDMKEIDRKLWESLNSTAVDTALKDFDTETIKNICNSYYRLSPYWIVMDDDYTKTAHYISTSSGVYIDISEESVNPRNPYTTWFHEYSHWLDNNAVDINSNIDVRSASLEYISIGDHGQSFYDALVQDSLIFKGKGSGNLAILNIINEAGDSAKVSEFTDIMRAVYNNNETAGGYGHSTSYWNYQDVKLADGSIVKRPDMDRLNKEAFAHFTEITLTQDTSDIEMLKKCFPNAYNEYLKMMKEAMEQ
ncbi:hypothetical protein [Anaerosacchariphilus polymeriproducens]|uniref:Uncharacterized protein n=1 Tax=Anaerosacchariphilus polymeriproducens TaxID=1812858 RepID=A0A371AXD5_9FIRM|nr:hypothetical protein [Anaerosacchariphilus polymeriproducens]RDU24238.1 hypothetical protein DWV06_05945 [Anaerosacchariphilus polymeriproducens]